MKFLICR